MITRSLDSDLAVLGPARLYHWLEAQKFSVTALRKLEDAGKHEEGGRTSSFANFQARVAPNRHHVRNRNPQSARLDEPC